MGQGNTFPLIEKHEVAPDHFELVFPLNETMAAAKPGQFVNLLCSGSTLSDPLLRRPLSLYSVSDDRFSVVFRVVGRGTHYLSRLRPKDTVDILGPLGTGFRLPNDEQSDVVLVGGGVGIPPLFYLSETLTRREINHRVVIGFSSAHVMFGVERWMRLGVTPIVTTDDGSAGRRGFVTEPLLDIFEKHTVHAVYSCGPRPMLQSVAAMSARFNVPCQVAMEEWMGCGVGVCLSCVHKVTSPHAKEDVWARICVEGPVFNGDEVVWS